MVFIALNLSCLKAEISERGRHGNGLSCFRERVIRGEDESRGAARGKGPAVSGLQGHRSLEGRKRKTWNLLRRVAENPGPESCSQVSPCLGYSTKPGALRGRGCLEPGGQRVPFSTPFVTGVPSPWLCNCCAQTPRSPRAAHLQSHTAPGFRVPGAAQLWAGTCSSWRARGALGGGCWQNTIWAYPSGLQLSETLISGKDPWRGTAAFQGAFTWSARVRKDPLLPFLLFFDLGPSQF